MQWIRIAFDVTFLTATVVLSVLHAQLPEPVTKQIESRYPRMEVAAAELDHDDGQVVYEVKLRDQVRLLEAEFDADGNFLSAEEEIAWAKTPAIVQSPFAKAYPRIEPVEVTSYTHQHLGEERVTYVIEFLAGGREREMGIDAEGKVLFDRVD